MIVDKIIKLTSISDGKPIYINVDHIGHFYRVPKKMSYNRVDKKEHTNVGVTTHNNGGFSVTETPEQIKVIILKLWK